MAIIISILQILAAVIGCLAVLVSFPLFFAFRWPAAAMWGVKLYVSAVSPVLAGVGLLVALTGIAAGSLFTGIVGLVVVVLYGVHLFRVTRPPSVKEGFERAFGWGWANKIAADQKAYFLPRRTALRLPRVPKARLEQDIPFATVPGTGRRLLCDVWQPPGGIRASRTAFIYLHGSAFYFLDKDFGTRPFFSHLAAQGHLIMDVAYRLAPETDIMGMVHDAKRAVAWLKAHARTYGIDPARVVIGGGSAGGHLALMTAYTSDDPQFTPPDVEGADLSVCAVVSLYGPTSLEGLYYHTNQQRIPRSEHARAPKPRAAKMSRWILQSAGAAYHRLGLDRDFEKVGTLAPLLGGHPDQCPERYAYLSPLTHVHAGCPPTLLIHGEHDIMSPVATTRLLYTRLVHEHVPAVLHLLPQTDHGFDLVLPRVAPATHNAIYDVERFIALMAAPEGLATMAGKGLAADRGTRSPGR